MKEKKKINEKMMKKGIYDDLMNARVIKEKLEINNQS